MKNPFFSNFFPKNVVNFIGDRSEDFTLLPDDIDLSAKQKSSLERALGFSIGPAATLRQVHGKKVVNVNEVPSAGNNFYGEADAFITNINNVALTIRTADCQPIFIYDQEHHAIGLVHAGWKGVYQQISIETVKDMQRFFGSNPSSLKIAIGPSIRSCCFEVTNEIEQYFPGKILKRNGKLFVDLIQQTYEHLESIGVKSENLVDSGICTHCSSRYHSFRRDAEKSGRMLSLMMIKPT